RAARPKKDARILVVVQLSGGNDGINTVVPFADEGYAKHRRALRLAANRLLKINRAVGLHPSLRGAVKLLETGRLAIVQGVGYPTRTRPHSQSRAIGPPAGFNPEEQKDLGWRGRGRDGGPRPADGAPASLLVGLDPPPVALQGRRSVTSALDRL